MLIAKDLSRSLAELQRVQDSILARVKEAQLADVTDDMTRIRAAIQREIEAGAVFLAGKYPP
jgi:hypothetical protein